MYNLRYHIATLVAVFLALAVGLLLGTVVVERGVLDQQKTTLVQGLTKDFETMRTANSDMRGQLDRTSAFAAEAVAPLVSTALQGRTVLLISDPSRGETLSRASEAVRLAGGVPAVATFASAGLGLGNADAKARAIAIVGQADVEALRAKVAETLAREFTLPENARPLTKALTESGQLTLEGVTTTTTVAAAVLTGAFEDKADPGQVALLAALNAQGRPAAGVESTKRRTGVAEAASRAKCSAVDDIDEPIGQVSLVWVLSGRTSGHFGIGKGAEAAFPSPLFPAR
jgi:hypothetical protein